MAKSKADLAQLPSTHSAEKFTAQTYLLGFFLIFIAIICSKYFQDHFTVIKWHAAHALGLALLAPLIFRQTFSWPKLSKQELFLLISLSIIGLGNIFYLRSLDFQSPLQDRLCFLILFYFFFLGFKEKKLSLIHFTVPILIATAIVDVYAFVEMITPKESHLYPYMAGVKASSLFGNTNMTAQFLGISILFQFQHLFSGAAKKINTKSTLLIFMFAFTLAYINYLACRSVMLALLSPLIWLSWQFRVWEKKKILLITLPLTLFFAITINNFRPEGNLFTKSYQEMQQQGTDNQNSMYLRLSLWESSLKLIKRNPMGVGTGNTEFNLVPFQVNTKVPADEKVVYNTPHNEYLRYLIEDGLVYTLMALALLVIWAGKFFPLVQKRGARPEDALIFALFAYYAVESFFQFPLLNAYPFVIFAMMLAYLLARTHTQESKTVRFVPQAGLALIFIMMAYLSWANIVSSYNIANLFKVREKMQTACSIFPSRWRGCLHLTQILIEEGKLHDADQELQRFLRQSPYHFVAMRLMGINQFKLGNMARGCFYFYQYDRLFDSKSSIHRDLMQNCPSITPEFERNHPFP